jgi:hypothetical protein
MMKRRMGVFGWGLTVTGLILMMATGVSRAQLIQDFSTGKVDWAQGYVYATAVGTANMQQMVNEVQAESVARKTARHQAFQQLSETVNKISIDAYATYGQTLMQDDLLKTETHGVLEGAHVFKDDFSWSQRGAPRALVTVRIAINGGLSKATVPYAERKAKTNPMPVFVPQPSEIKKAKVEETFTGLIIDASGTGARPTMIPRILTGDGLREVYGPSVASPQSAMVNNFAAYSNDVNKAKSIPRLGANPMVIKAEKASGPLSGDLTVSDEDAARILLADNKSKFLQDCKVVIVLN